MLLNGRHATLGMHNGKLGLGFCSLSVGQMQGQKAVALDIATPSDTLYPVIGFGWMQACKRWTSHVSGTNITAANCIYQ